MNRRDSPYETLGVSVDATEADIKQAYKRLSRKYHPDLAKDIDPVEAAELFQQATRAKEILLDSDKRQLFDLGGWQLIDRAEEAQTMRENHVPQCDPIVVRKHVTLGQLYRCDEVPIDVTVQHYAEDGSVEDVPFHTDLKLVGQECRICIQQQGTVRPDHLTGDIIVEVILDDPDFSLKGNDLVYTARLTLEELINGYERTILHPDGKAYLVTGAYDFENDENVRIFPALGMPNQSQKSHFLRGRSGGDLVVHLLPNIDKLGALTEDECDRLSSVIRDIDGLKRPEKGDHESAMNIDSMSRTPEEMRAHMSATVVDGMNVQGCPIS